jgi:hypothetical protein
MKYRETREIDFYIDLGKVKIKSKLTPRIVAKMRALTRFKNFPINKCSIWALL